MEPALGVDKPVAREAVGATPGKGVLGLGRAMADWR